MKLDNGYTAHINVTARNKTGALRQAIANALQEDQAGVKALHILKELPAEKKKRKKYFKEKKKEYDAKYLV